MITLTRNRLITLAGSLLAAMGLARSAELPRLSPDYAGVTLPPNIAPLNFRIQEPALSYRVVLRSSTGSPIVLSSRDPVIRIPPRPWTTLLRANPAQPLYWDISAQTASVGWKQFATVTNHIAQEEIDGWLAYRLLTPIFNYYVHLGIYQRNLGSFEQRPILRNEQIENRCLNCHTPLNRRPDTFALNIRGQGGRSPMILVTTNQATRVDKTMGYLAWHPSGRVIVFSANSFFFFFHTQGETRDIYDGKSDLGIYRVDSNTVSYPPAIAAPDRNETWPAWSPDGRYLYFSSAALQPREKFREVRYDLMRVSFDIQTGQWGQPELIISSGETGLSACEPKISPDGHFLVATLCRYGNFPIYQSDSDLYAMNLATRHLQRLEINSGEADTWHSWSSNSRWLVFSSKRLDGLLARPYFSYVDEHGVFHKPFVLPQQDPTFYAYCVNTFNVPELMQGPVTVSERDLAKAAAQGGHAVAPQGPPGPPSSASQPSPDDAGYRQIRE